MKNLLIILFVLFSSIPGFSQQMSPAMKKYADGCFLLREAIAANDFGKLLDAKLKFGGLKLGQFSEEDFTPADSLSLSVISMPTVLFTPQFATHLVEAGEITIGEIVDAHMMRKGDGELYLWHASIAPKSSASFVCEGEDDCELFLCSMPMTDLKLSVHSQSVGTIDVLPVGDGKSAWYASWNMRQPGGYFVFTIKNDSDSSASFVIASN